MSELQPLHLLIVVIVALILFGPNQLPKIASALKETLREFRTTTEETRKPIEDAAKTVRDLLSEPLLLVFVSSIMDAKCEDLAAERAAAKKAIEALPLSRTWRFEDSSASPETAQRVFLQKVRECDIFILVLGKEITYPVLHEFVTARKHNKPRLVFLKKCERTLATQIFVGKISQEVKWKDFSAVNDLAKQIQIAIVDLLLLKFRDKLTVNEIIALTGLLSQWFKPEIVPPDQTPKAASTVSRLEILEPEPPRSDKAESDAFPELPRFKILHKSIRFFVGVNRVKFKWLPLSHPYRLTFYGRADCDDFWFSEVQVSVNGSEFGTVNGKIYQPTDDGFLTEWDVGETRGSFVVRLIVTSKTKGSDYESIGFILPEGAKGVYPGTK